MIKIDLLTGFLGSGKTTFLRHYAKYLTGKGEKIAILENDYGAVNVDALLLGELEGASCSIETVAGGGDQDCHIRRFRTKLIALGMQGFDRVIVEPSGIYDVDEFFDVLHDEPLDRWYEAGNVIAIVNAREEKELSEEARYFLLSQTSPAGILLLSHIQEGETREAEGALSFINGIMEEFGCDRRFDAGDILSKEWASLTEEDYRRISSCGYRLADHIKLPFLSHNNFSTLYYLNLNLSLQEMKEKAAGLMQDQSIGVVCRIKGFHCENGQWYELNASRDSLKTEKSRSGQEVFIIIGENLNQEEIGLRLGISEDVWHNGQVYAGRAEK